MLAGSSQDLSQVLHAMPETDLVVPARARQMAGKHRLVKAPGMEGCPYDHLRASMSAGIPLNKRPEA